jgi:WD40 repeat protein
MDNYNNQNLGYDPSGQGYYDNSAGYYGDGGQMYQEGEVYQKEGSAGMYPPSYGAEGVDPNMQYYAQNQYDYSQQGWNQAQGAQEWAPQVPAESRPKGSYYFHAEFTPQIFGFPVTSLAYDSGYDAMYVASATQSMTTTRWKSHRASMLATHSTLDGMCFSSVGGHPEAPISLLNQVYECMYGIKKTVPVAPGRQHIPPHAYRPPYGGSQVETMAAPGGKQGHIGITDMLSLNGYAATISPSAVRIHSHGGLQVHDHDIEGMLCGTLHPHSGQGEPTHISVGGLTCGDKYSHHDIFCMDIRQGLRVVNSWAFNNKRYATKAGVTAMATSQERGSIVAGCTDGNIRILDGSLRELATIKSHVGGVSSMSVSPDGMLIAAAGYSSRVAPGKETSILYGFPDTRIYIYDMRYLGRGGIPHMFAGGRGCPRHVSFVPDVENHPSNRLLVASGQPGGGLQMLVPLEEPDENNTSFFAPQLAQGESISAMEKSEDDLALGTSAGRVLRYRLAGYKSKTKTLSASPSAFVPAGSRSPNQRSSGHSSLEKSKKPLDISKLYEQPMTKFSIDPKLLLQNGDSGMRNGNDEKIKSLFSTYVLQADPKLSSVGYSVENAVSSFGSLGGKPIIAGGRRSVSQSFIKEAATGDEDFLVTIPTPKLDLDIFADHTTRPKRRPYNKAPKQPKANPNKLLHCQKLSALCYEDGLNGRRRQRGHQSQGSVSNLNQRVTYLVWTFLIF